MKIKEIKKGMKVLLTETTRGYGRLCNIPLTVTSVGSNSFNAKCSNSEYAGTFSFYPENGDTIAPVSRKEHAKFLRSKITELQKSISEMEKEADFLEMYETEEDFVAAKLDAIISAGSTEDPKKRIVAIKEVVKTLKETHYL